MNKKLIRIIASAILLAGAVIIENIISLPVWQLLLVYLIPYLLIGYDIIGEAIEGLTHGDSILFTSLPMVHPTACPNLSIQFCQ